MTKSKKIALIVVALLAVAIITLVCVFVKLGDSYIVTYDLNGGTMDETETRVWFDSEYVLPVPSKRGYAFVGWYYGEKAVNTTGVWKYEEDITLKAKWEIRDLNGIVYSPVKGGYVVSGFNGDLNKTIMVPTMHNDIKVVGVESSAFANLDGNVEQAKYKYIKVYIPATIISREEALSLGKNLMINRYTSVDDDGLIYLEENGEVAVVGYDGDYNSNIHVSESYNGKPVTAIGDYAFYGATYFFPKKANDFYRIRIPKTIKAIGQGAFGMCDGVRVVLYSLKGDSVREVVDKSQQYDWLVNVTIADGNNEFKKVISQILPAFGWSEYTAAKYYVRLNSMGGKITELVEVKDEEGKVIEIPVTVQDASFYKNTEYSLPTPVREGFSFDGWYYNDTLVPQNGSSWNYDTHIELVAKWTEIQKEG